jgi:NAD(P)-dependent dehydrogenase (short-subunit alcohol dehydrogenase family)
VINAGIADFRPIEAFDEAGFDRSFAVNAKGPYFLIQALLPVLSNPASIVFNGSINARIGMPNQRLCRHQGRAYLAGAHAVGRIDWPRHSRQCGQPRPRGDPALWRLGLSEEQLSGMQQAILGQLPAGRFGTPDEIADAFVYFASDESRFTIGSELVVDGGMSNL